MDTRPTPPLADQVIRQGPAQDNECADLQNELSRLRGELHSLERIRDEEHDLGESQRDRLLRRIREVNQAIDEVTIELQSCDSDRLRIAGIELTQANQFFYINGQGSHEEPNNNVPLVARRPLILRVYPDYQRQDPTAPTVPLPISGRVTVRRIESSGHHLVGVLTPINGPIAPRSADTLDRQHAYESLNFRLPAADCRGTLQFVAEIFQVPQPVIFAISSSATAISTPGLLHSPLYGLTKVSEPVPAFRIFVELTAYTGGGQNLPAPTVQDFLDDFQFVLQTYPIGRRVISSSVEQFNGDLSIPSTDNTCGPAWKELLERLEDHRGDSNDIYFALLPAGVISSGTGCGRRGDMVAAAIAGASSGATMAQEIGHALGRQHAPSGGAPDPDPSYPTYDSYQEGSIGEFGMDYVTSQVFSPVLYVDFMGYGWPPWVSPYTYTGLRNLMFDKFGEAASFRAMGMEREVLHLRFRLHRDGTVELQPSFHLPSRMQDVDRRPLADVACELLGKGGEVLSYRRCHIRDSRQDPDGPYLDFSESVLWVDQAESIRFLKGRDVLHVHDIEPGTPDVVFDDAALKRADFSQGEELVELRWKPRAKTRTHAELNYMLRYSSDGGTTWRGLISGLRQSSYKIDPRQLPGGKQCCFQVVASSGVRTAIAQTKYFDLPIKPRTAKISRPAPMSEFISGSEVLLRGWAMSADYALDSMEDATWTSSLDGRIGLGLEAFCQDLSDGLHLITLTVPDGLEGIATDTVAIRVRPPE